MPDPWKPAPGVRPRTTRLDSTGHDTAQHDIPSEPGAYPRSETDADSLAVHPADTPATDAPAKDELYPAVPEDSILEHDPRTGAITVVSKGSPRHTMLERARNALRAASAPTWGVDLREVNDGIEQARSRSVIDLAMRLAEMTLATGASAADVTANVLTVTKAYGLRSVHVDVTFTSISVTHHRGAYQDPVTMIRTVSMRSADYDRLARCDELITAIAEDGLSLEQARARFTGINEQPRLYRRAVVSVGMAMLGGGVATLIGGKPAEIAIAVLSSFVIDRALLATARHRLPSFFSQMVGGAIPTVVLLVLIASGSHLPDALLEVRPSVVVSTGITVLLAGMSVVAAAQDAIDGYYVTAAARTYEVVMLTLGIIVGVIAVLTFGQLLGVPSYLIPPRVIADSLGVQMLGVVLTAVGSCLSSYGNVSTVLASAVLAVLSWLAYVLFGTVGLDPTSATTMACLLLGVASQSLSGWLKIPSLALLSGGFIAFLPGGLVFRGLYYLVEPVPAPTPAMDGPALLAGAGTTGMAIAGGVSLGIFLGRRVRWRSGLRSSATARALQRASADA